jgi:two-component system C4-dicarboxylate transport sensor histidine kinase DctB
MASSTSNSTWRSHEDGGGLTDDDRGREAHRLAELGLLTAGLLHELRQPVFALKALAQIAESQPARAGELLRQALAQADTLETLIEGYADFSRRPLDRREVFELAAPVRSAMAVLGHRAGQARVAVELDLGPGVAVRGSHLAVQQAVVNLGQNAIDALRGRAGGRLRIAAAADVGGARLRVEDNGPGLPAEIRAHLFQPFHTTKPTGTGLGLSISRDVLRASGGDLVLVEATEGTCWEIVLPAA